MLFIFSSVSVLQSQQNPTDTLRAVGTAASGAKLSELTDRNMNVPFSPRFRSILSFQPYMHL